MSDLTVAVAALVEDHGAGPVLLEATRQAVAGAPAMVVVSRPLPEDGGPLTPGWSHPDAVEARARALAGDREPSITPKQLETVVNLIERRKLDQVALLAPYGVELPEHLTKAAASKVIDSVLGSRA